MTRTRTRRLAALALAAGLAFGASGCTGSPLDDIVEGVVQQGVDEITGGIDESVRGLVDGVLGGAAISTDGSLPSGFPNEVVVTGEVVGGAAGPEGTGWVAQSRLGGGAGFEDAAAALERAGFSPSNVSSDADSGFGSFTSASYRVDLAVATDAEGVVTATYVVTPA
mgnify:CR=1 FL=1